MAGITIGELVAHLDLQDANWRQGMTRAQQDLKKLEGQLNNAARPIQQFGTRLDTTAKSASISVNRLQSGFLVLAAQATNTNPAVARLATTVSAFAVGGWVTIGVLGGLALIGTAWDKLSEKTRTAKDETQKLIDKYLELGKARILGATGEAETALGAAGVERARLVARQTELRRSLSSPQTEQEVEAAPRFRKELEKIGAALEKLTIVSQGATGELDDAAAAKAEADKKAAEDAHQAALATELFNIQLRELNFRAKQAADGVHAMMIEARMSLAASGLDMGPRNMRMDLGLRRPNANLDLRPMVVMEGVATRFQEAVTSFGNGVKQIVQGMFSNQAFENIGANLASNAIGFIAGKLISGLTDAFQGVDRLAEALEQNTRALKAGADFLGARLAGSGMADAARKALDAIQNTIDRIAVGDDAGSTGRGDPNSFINTFEEEIAKLGLTMADINALAALLGIDLGEILSEGTLEQFFEQLEKAVGGLDSLGDEARRTADALKNVPDGFKIANAMFGATEGVARGSAMGGVTQNFQPGAIVIDATGMTPEQILPALEREAARLAARGRPSVLQRGTMNR